MINFKSYAVQERFLVLTFPPQWHMTFPPCYKQWHRLIAFVGIKAALCRGSPAHGCYSEEQESCKQGCNCSLEQRGQQRRRAGVFCVGLAVSIHEARLWCGTWRTKSTLLCWGSCDPVHLQGLPALQAFLLCRCPLLPHFPENFTWIALESFREKVSLPKSGMILGGWRNQKPRLCLSSSDNPGL